MTTSVMLTDDQYSHLRDAIRSSWRRRGFTSETHGDTTLSREWLGGILAILQDRLSRIGDGSDALDVAFRCVDSWPHEGFGIAAADAVFRAYTAIPPEMRSGEGVPEESDLERTSEAASPEAAELEANDRPPEKESAYDELKALIACGERNIMLFGDSGLGKTSMVIALAEELGLPLYVLASPQTKADVIGFRDAVGNECTTSFTEGYTRRCIILLEEIDRASARACIAFNAGIANGILDVPVRGTIRRDPGCIVIATANTSGNGATYDYNSAVQLDTSTLDRFARLRVGLDPSILMDCAGGDRALYDFSRSWISASERLRMTDARLTYRGVERLRRVGGGAGIPFALRASLTDSMTRDAVGRMSAEMHLDGNPWKEALDGILAERTGRGE